MANSDTTSLLPKNCHRHQNSSCCYNEYLIESNQTCAECPHGTFGFNCQFKCNPGFYGRLCQSHCQCQASTCHHVTGCIEGTFSSSNIELNTTSTIETLNHTHTRTTVVDGSYTTHRPPVNIHHSHSDPIVYFLMATILSFFIFGFIVYIRLRKRNTKFICCAIKHVPIPDVDSANCRLQEQEENVEASNFQHRSNCGIEEDDLYAEIRFSKLVDVHVAEASGFCKTSKAASGKGRYSSPRKSNNYQHCMFDKEYDHVHLKRTRSVSDLDDGSLGMSNAEEYVVLKENTTLQKQCKPDDKLDQQTNLTFPRQMRTRNQQMDSERPLSDDFLQLSNEKEQQMETQSLTGRTYSLVHGVSENVVSGTMEEASCLFGTQHEVGRGENESSKQSDARPYSFAMLLQ